MPESATWTIGQLLQWTADYLKDHGADSPRLDAEVLLAHARGCGRIDLYTCFDEPADEALRSDFRQLVKRRAAGTPVAYLVGHREFYSRSFQVNPDVLIPRPETEFVLIGMLDLVKANGLSKAALRIADVGTGSGNLAVSVALQVPQADVTAIDISPSALEVARANAQRHGVDQRVQFVASDLFDELPQDEQFDIIVSNPPYIGEDEKASLPRDVVDYEPATALFAGPQGLDVIDRLLAAAVERLKPGGWLLSELNPAQADAVTSLVARHAELEEPEFVDDLSRRPRVVKVRRRS